MMEKQPNTCPHCGTKDAGYGGRCRDITDIVCEESELFPGLMLPATTVQAHIWDFFCVDCNKYVFTEHEIPDN